MSHSRSIAAARAAVAALVLACALALTACSSAAQTFDQTAEQGVSAVGTAELVIRQQLDGRTYDTSAVATLGDARTELEDATTSVAETTTTTRADAAARRRLLEQIVRALDAVDAAVDALQGDASEAERTAVLEDSMRELERLGAEFEASVSASGTGGGS